MPTTESLNKVQNLYIAYYGRPADPEGLNAWAEQLDNAGGDASAIIDLFGDSPEYTNRFGDLSNEELVNNLYQQLFGRDAEAEGLELYTGLLDSGEQTLGSIALTILENASGDDVAVVANRKAVADAFVAALDTPEEVAAYSGDAAAEAAKAMLASVDADTDVEAFDVDSVIAQLVADAPEEPTEPTEPSVPGEELFLTASTDVVTGTENDDSFMAYLSQNPMMGGISNTLSSADRLDGGEGSDYLFAEIIPEFAGSTGLAEQYDIQPRTTSIETVEFEVRDLGMNRDSFGEGAYGSSVDAKHMYGIQSIGSKQSDGDLVIENLTTLANDRVTKRNTSDVTITMDHTDNVNSDGDPSDLIVYFDENYLLSGQSSEGNALYWLLDQDSDLVGGPLLDEINVDGIRFTINGGEAIELSSPDAMAANTHVEFVAALQSALAALITAGTVPAGTTLTLDANQSRTTYLDDGSVSSQVPAIVLTTGDGSQVEPIGFNFVEDQPGEFNLWSRFDDTYDTAQEPITSNIELLKVGRGAQGGDLIVGGKDVHSNKGVEVFNITVEGDSSLPSHLGALNSTSGVLEEVNVVTDASVTGDNGYAELSIANLGGTGTGAGIVPENDVQRFDSTGFMGDLTMYTNLDESGNGAHVYNLGSGNDNLTIDLGNAVQAFGGIAGDSLAVSTGAGNDTVVMHGGADLESLVVNAGSGDNTIYFDATNDNAATDGGGARIVSGSGNDAIYLHGDYANMLGNDVALLPLDLSGTGTPQSFQMFGAVLRVSVDGVESEWVDVDYSNSTYTTSRSDIRAAIQDAVDSNPALAGMIQIVELTDGTLAARSLIEGGSTVDIEIQGPVGNASEINNGTTLNNGGALADTNGAGWDLLNSQDHLNTVSLSQLKAAWEAWYPQSTAFETGGSFGSDAPTDWISGSDATSAATLLDAMNAEAATLTAALTGETLNGPIAGAASGGNVINSGAGEDLISLETDTDENNVVEMSVDHFGTNTIVNFTVGSDANDLSDNDVLDFFSYLDDAAAERGDSVGNQDARVDESVDYSFTNLVGVGADADATSNIDHNSITMIEFSDVWDSFATNAPANFDSFSAANLESYFSTEIAAGDFVTGSGANATAAGNNFLILVAKDGDVTVDVNGNLTWDNAALGSAADNQFMVFEGTITAYNGGAGTYSVDFTERGLIDLAGVDLTTLTADEFGIII